MNPWEQKSFNETFDILTNNTLSRAELNYEDGEYKNIHYGDVLIKFPAHIDTLSADVPYINDENASKKFDSALLHNGDIVFADTAEDYTVGKATEIEITAECKVVSGLHTIPCRPKMRFSPRYLGYFVNSPKYHNQLIPYIQGVKVSSISKTLIKNTTISYPSIEEQAKIASFLSCLDEKIEVQNKIISKYETLIKGLKNQLYSRKARFTSHNKIPFPKWEKKQLSEILSISTEKNGSQYSKEKVLSVSDEYGVVNQIKFQGKSFAGQDISNYKVVKSGQIIYTRSPLAAKPFGIIKIVGNEIGIVSPLYIVNTVNNGYDALFVFYLFDTPQSTNNYLKPLVRVGAKHTMNISNDEWLSGTVIIPCLEEQKMIAGVLQSIDKKISFEKKVLEILKEQKTYLLSKMFI